LPKILGYFETKRDQAHELKMADKQQEMALAMGNQKMQMMDISADIAETQALHQSASAVTQKASQFWINVSASVRPCITYFLFLEFVILTFLLAFGYIDGDLFKMIWSEDTMAPIFSAACAFYFGQRSFNRK
jgi:hypothetical protein